MFAYAVSRLDGADSDGIHLIWAGPRTWGYSHDGYIVLRRQAIRTEPRQCVTIDGARLAQLHADHGLPFELGTARYRLGPCPQAFVEYRNLDELGGFEVSGPIALADIMARVGAASTV